MTLYLTTTEIHKKKLLIKFHYLQEIKNIPTSLPGEQLSPKRKSIFLNPDLVSDIKNLDQPVNHMNNNSSSKNRY